MCRSFAKTFLLLGPLLACGSSSDGATNPYPLPVVPALESVPYALLGSGKVAFERIGASGYDAIYVIDATAMSSAHSFDTTLAWGPALSPDGRRLAYMHLTDLTTGWDVYVANIDGTGVQQATRFTQQESPPTWTPDGAKIVVPRVVGSSLVRNVYSQSPVANPGDVIQLTNFTLGTGGVPACPIIFFDSDVLVAISTQGELAFACSFGEIDVLSSNGAVSASYLPVRDDRRHWPNVFAASWSPDGTRLAFVETTTDSAMNYAEIGLAVKVMNADGSNVTTVAIGAGSNAQVGGGWIGPNNFSLCWMPDGSRIVFNVPESGLVGHLWVVRVDGTGLAQLTSAPGAWDRSVSCSR
jgi:Tol biopolymer transport system component